MSAKFVPVTGGAEPARRGLAVVSRGVLRPAIPGTRHATNTYPNVTVLSQGQLLATVRTGTGKDTPDETIELFESRDGGATWLPRAFAPPTQVGGKRGSTRSCHLTELAPGHLLAATLWIDRQTYPGQPLFNPETEGCLPMTVLLAESRDAGTTWSSWRAVPMPEAIGPPSITTAIMQLRDGTLAMSIETNKTYLDRSPWYQKVVLLHSKDGGETWGPPVTAGEDPTGRIFNWDQRAAVAPDGRIAAFLWTYDSQAHTYLNVHRRLSSDGGRTWSAAEDLGFADQPGHPAILADGRVVLSYVDRFQSQSIRARWAPDVAAPFEAATEVIIHEQKASATVGPETGTTTAALVEMGMWSYGLPSAEALPDGDVLVVYYAGRQDAMDARWARLRLPAV